MKLFTKNIVETRVVKTITETLKTAKLSALSIVPIKGLISPIKMINVNSIEICATILFSFFIPE